MLFPRNALPSGPQACFFAEKAIAKVKGASLSGPAFLAEGSFRIRVDTFWAGMLCERGLATSLLSMIDDLGH
jgi:hypothetical protein